MKVVIPVAGLGTRMLPATKAIPKEMLPVVDKPLIQYVVDEAVAAGAKEIVLVTHASKNSIENHFDTSFELEATLEKRVKRQLLEDVQAICPPDVKIISVRQGKPKGLGHAIACAYPIVGDSDFAVILPDVLIAANPNTDNDLKQMIDRFGATSRGQIMVERVAKESVSQYGIVDIGNRPISDRQSAPIAGMVEKPDPENTPSNLAIVGRYVMPKELWPLLLKTPPGKGDEVQLTDALAMLLEADGQLDAYCMTGNGMDCGSKLGYMLANVELALQHPEIGQEFREKLNSLLTSKPVIRQ